MRWLMRFVFVFGLIFVVIGANRWSNADFQVGYAFATPAGARLSGAMDVGFGLICLLGAGGILYMEKRGFLLANLSDPTEGRISWAYFVRWMRELPWGERIYTCAALLFGSGVGVASGLHAIRNEVWMNGRAFGWVAQIVGFGAVCLGMAVFAVAVVLGAMGFSRGR